MISNIDVERRSYPTDTFQGQGFSIAQRLFSPNDLAGKNTNLHIIHFNNGIPFELSWQSPTQTTNTICEPGNFIQILTKGKEHSLCGNEKYNAIELSFDAKYIDTITEKENFTFCDQHNFQDPLLSLLIRQLFAATRSQIPENMYIQSLVIACAIHLTTTYAAGSKKIFSLKGKLSSHQLKSVILFIRDSISRTVTLEELAACCHLSVFHFSRLFKNTLGVSPYQHVLRTKIEHARSLIKSQRAVGEIAYSLGFTDSAHFCNSFKKFTGHSPLQYYFAVTQGLSFRQYAAS